MRIPRVSCQAYRGCGSRVLQIVDDTVKPSFDETAGRLPVSSGRNGLFAVLPIERLIGLPSSECVRKEQSR